MKEYDVYNLVFPDYVDEMEIFGYIFRRAEDYPDRLQALSQHVEIWSEFHIERNTGNHAITAKVEVPEKQKKFVLEWGGTSENWALHDIMLLLSLFSSRNVFLRKPTGTEIIKPDYRVHPYGGNLRTSLRQEFEPIAGTENQADRGFERNLTEIYKLIRTLVWQKKYGKGFFLFLLRSAFQPQILETSFILCWTIWEHLFTLHNKNWLDEEKIHRLSGIDKIANIFVEYDLFKEIDSKSRKVIQKLCKTRNKLTHFGKFPDKNPNSKEDAEIFIRLTEIITAKILGLTPSDIFSAENRLKRRVDEITKNK